MRHSLIWFVGLVVIAGCSAGVDPVGTPSSSGKSEGPDSDAPNLDAKAPWEDVKPNAFLHPDARTSLCMAVVETMKDFVGFASRCEQHLLTPEALRTLSGGVSQQLVRLDEAGGEGRAWNLVASYEPIVEADGRRDHVTTAVHRIDPVPADPKGVARRIILDVARSCVDGQQGGFSCEGAPGERLAAWNGVVESLGKRSPDNKAATEVHAALSGALAPIEREWEMDSEYWGDVQRITVDGQVAAYALGYRYQNDGGWYGSWYFIDPSGEILAYAFFDC